MKKDTLHTIEGDPFVIRTVSKVGTIPIAGSGTAQIGVNTDAPTPVTGIRINPNGLIIPLMFIMTGYNLTTLAPTQIENTTFYRGNNTMGGLKLPSYLQTLINYGMQSTQTAANVSSGNVQYTNTRFYTSHFAESKQIILTFNRVLVAALESDSPIDFGSAVDPIRTTQIFTYAELLG